jgi:hypothetical protein
MKKVTLRIYDPAEGLICQFLHPAEAGRKLYRDLSCDSGYTKYRLALFGPDGQLLEGEAPPAGSLKK